LKTRLKKYKILHNSSTVKMWEDEQWRQCTVKIPYHLDYRLVRWPALHRRPTLFWYKKYKKKKLRSKSLESNCNIRPKSLGFGFDCNVRLKSIECGCNTRAKTLGFGRQAQELQVQTLDPRPLGPNTGPKRLGSILPKFL